MALNTSGLDDLPGGMEKLKVTDNSDSLSAAMKALIQSMELFTASLRKVQYALQDAFAQSAIDKLVGRQLQKSSTVQKLLVHFDRTIMRMSARVLETLETKETETEAGSEPGHVLAQLAEELLAQLAEELYRETRGGGELDADDYFIPLGEAALGWPYDADYESEAYYEHQDRLDQDYAYAKMFHDRALRREESERRERQQWPDFWLRILNQCPGGPTLFPPEIGACHETPRYLFRVFDRKSTGWSDQNVVRSPASLRDPDGQTSRTCLLSLDPGASADMLHKHLKWQPFGVCAPDNLVSWTSSLLFAIQCAIYRRHYHHLDSGDIQICAVDTHMFCPNQFARDAQLICAVATRSADQCEAENYSDFFNFRLSKTDYYNGEYLSQGRVNHRGRSCVFSLKRLVEQGLYDLYPEFDEPRGNDIRWARRVLYLRRLWSTARRATAADVQKAYAIATGCSPAGTAREIALMLLCFRNCTEISTTPSDFQPPDPDEVRRYRAAAQTVQFAHTANEAADLESLLAFFSDEAVPSF